MADVNILEDSVDNVITVSCPYDVDFIEAAKEELEGVWDADEQIWTFDMDVVTLDEVKDVLRRYFKTPL